MHNFPNMMDHVASGYDERETDLNLRENCNIISTAIFGITGNYSYIWIQYRSFKYLDCMFEFLTSICMNKVTYCFLLNRSKLSPKPETNSHMTGAPKLETVAVHCG